MKSQTSATLLTLALAFAGLTTLLFADHHESEFGALTIDLGVVVSDIDKAVEFYTKAVGFKEVPGFRVPAEFAKDAGLTDSKELNIRVLVLGEGEGATKLKLMQVEGGSKKSDNTHINSQLGFSYITVMVKSTDQALARLKKAGVKPIAKGPVALPADLDPELSLTIVQDPDGNFVELVGPKPSK